MVKYKKTEPDHMMQPQFKVFLLLGWHKVCGFVFIMPWLDSTFQKGLEIKMRMLRPFDLFASSGRKDSWKKVISAVARNPASANTHTQVHAQYVSSES